jgi:hypothetical protein
MILRGDSHIGGDFHGEIGDAIWKNFFWEQSCLPLHSGQASQPRSP